MSDLRELLKRVEAATGVDRDLDAAIAQSLDDFEIPVGAKWDALSDCFVGGHYGHYTFHEVRDYTASIDTCRALMAKLIPDWMLWLSGPWSHGWTADISPDWTSQRQVSSRPTAPLAILVVLLRAHQEGR